jgi:hypothetical protein
MNLRTVFISIATLSSLTIFQASAFADLSGEAITGRIRSSDGGHVRVCFERDAAASVNTEFAVLRHSVRTLPKGPATIESTPTGIIKIVSLDTDGCANAAVVSGSVQALDWVAARTSL